jgi:transcription-repair coupling factor (superfamily II helicase)
MVPTIDLPLQAHIPEDYVPESALRLKLYRRLADITTYAQVDGIEQELKDRFGAPPEEVRNLLYLLRLRVAAMQAHLAAIAIEDGRIILKFGKEDDALAARLNARFRDRVKISRDRAWLAGPDDDFQWREYLMDVVKAAAGTAVDSRQKAG